MSRRKSQISPSKQVFSLRELTLEGRLGTNSETFVFSIQGPCHIGDESDQERPTLAPEKPTQPDES